MQEVDASTLVPSTRDLLQVVSTRRRSLALLALISGEQAGADAARLADLNVSALAALEAGEAMRLAARATKTLPMLCLVSATDRTVLQAARQSGADGVCIDAALPLDDWDRHAKIARTMRMLPLALATDAASLAAAVASGARGVILRAASAADVVELAGKAPRTMTLVGYVDQADAGADAVRALVGKVDAAVVSASVHAAPGFAALVAEVDP